MEGFKTHKVAVAHQSSVSVWHLAEVIMGMLSATRIAMLPAPLHYCNLQFQDRRSSQPPLRIKSNSEQREQAKLREVDPQSTVQQWQTHQLPDASSGDRFNYIEYRLGPAVADR